MIHLTTVLVFATFSALSFANNQNCFNPEKNKTIQAFLKPNELQVLLLTPKKDEKVIPKTDNSLNENAETIKSIHEKIREAFKRYDIDPRLIYGFMIGESLANPSDITVDGAGADKREKAGLFSFRLTALKEVKEACEKAKQPRLCQLNYYIDKYIPAQIDIIGEACMKKTWNELSQGEKFVYLMFDSCRSPEMAKRVCLSDRRYQNSGACGLIQEVFDWNNFDSKRAPRTPLCEEYVNQARTPPATMQQRTPSDNKKGVEP